jgi:hypothetical protein
MRGRLLGSRCWAERLREAVRLNPHLFPHVPPPQAAQLGRWSLAREKAQSDLLCFENRRQSDPPAPARKRGGRPTPVPLPPQWDPEFQENGTLKTRELRGNWANGTFAKTCDGSRSENGD